jgi:hypothetical protein
MSNFNADVLEVNVAASVDVNVAEEQIADLWIRGNDAKGVRVTNYTVGKRTIAEYHRSLKSVDKGTTEDFRRKCNSISNLIVAKMGGKPPRIDDCVRFALWVDDAAKLIGLKGREAAPLFSYAFVVNELFKETHKLEEAEGSAHVKKGWEPTFANVVRGLTDPDEDAKWARRDVLAEIDAKKAENVKSKSEPDEVAKKRGARTKQQNAMANAVDTMLKDGLSDPVDILNTIEKVFADRGQSMPQVGLDPSAITLADCKPLAAAMFAAGKYAEMAELVRLMTLMLESHNTSKVA